MIKFVLYLGRWQLSSFVLAPVLSVMTGSPLWDMNVIGATIVANLIGGSIFFWIDKRIFSNNKEKYNDKNI